MSKKILMSCILAMVVITAAMLGISSCGRNGRLESITVLPENISIIPGTSQPYQAQGHLSDGTIYYLSMVNWSLSSYVCATISDPNSGLVSARTTTNPVTGLQSAVTGTVIITAADPYSTFMGTTLLTVDLLSSVTVTPYLPSMTPGLTHQFFATGYVGANGAIQDLTSQPILLWTSLTPSVATIVSTPGIVGSGVLTSVTTGTAIIQASIQTFDANGPKTVIGTTMLAVKPVALSSLTITPSNPAPISMATATTQSFSLTGTYSDQSTRDWTLSAFWSSSDTTVATIDPFNPADLDAANTHIITVNAVAPGTTTITATDPITGIAISTALTFTTP